MRRSYAAMLALVVLTLSACTDDPEPPAPAPSTPSSTPTASVSKAWASDERVRPDWIGRTAPWLWRYSDDVVVIGPRGLVALDRASGAVLWRLPLGGRVCGATPTPSRLGLVAVTVGRCEVATTPTRNGTRIATGGPATARRTTIKAVDLESASIVWERPFDGAPQLESAGDVLAAVDGCATRRIDLSSGRPRGGLGIACRDRVLAGEGIVVTTSEDDPRQWRVIDIESGSTLTRVRAPRPLADPRRILGADPVTVLVDESVRMRLDVASIDGSQVRVLGQVPTGASDAFASMTDESLVLAGPTVPGAVELSLDDGSRVKEFGAIGAEQWIPFARLGGSVLGFEGTSEGLDAGRGALTLRPLDGEADDEGVTEVGDFGAGSFLGDTNLAVAGPRAVVIDDILLMPGHGNAGVLAYRLSIPD